MSTFGNSKPVGTFSVNAVSVQTIMHDLLRENGKYLQSYKNKKTMHSIEFFARITEDTTVKKQHAEMRQSALRGLLCQWKKSEVLSDLHERAVIQETLTKLFRDIIIRDLDKDKEVHGLFRRTERVKKMLTVAKEKLDGLKVPCLAENSADYPSSIKKPHSR